MNRKGEQLFKFTQLSLRCCLEGIHALTYNNWMVTARPLSRHHLSRCTSEII